MSYETMIAIGVMCQRDKIGGFGLQDRVRENSGLNAWIEFLEGRPKLDGLDKLDMEACLDFAEWRRD